MSPLAETEQVVAEMHEPKPLSKVEMEALGSDYFTQEEAAKLAKTGQAFLKWAARHAGLEDIVTNVTFKRASVSEEGKNVMGYTSIKITTDEPIYLNGSREKVIQAYANLLGKKYEIDLIESNEYLGHET